MTVTHVPPRLTRVVIDDDTIEIAYLQFTRRIHEMLPQVPACERDFIARALLNLAFRAIDRSESLSALR